MDESLSRLVTILNTLDPAEARVVRSYLEAHGVAAFEPDWNYLTVNPWIGVALGGARIQVPESDVDAAQNLMKGIGGHTFEHCPSCGSDNIFRLPFVWFASWPIHLAMLAMSCWLPHDSGRRLCRSCRHCWRAKVPNKFIFAGATAVIIIFFMSPLLTGIFIQVWDFR